MLTIESSCRCSKLYATAAAAAAGSVILEIGLNNVAVVVVLLGFLLLIEVNKEIVLE